MKVPWGRANILAHFAMGLVLVSVFPVHYGFIGWAIPTPNPTPTVEPRTFNRECTYVLYQDSGIFLANNCLTGGNDYKELTASALMADMQTAMTASGGEIAVQKGSWTLASQWPTSNIKGLVELVGEGPSTLFQPGGAGNFDPINVALVNVFNFNMVDKYGIQVSFVCDAACSGQQQQSFALDTAAASGIGTTLISFLGNYIRLDSQAAAFPGFETGYAIAFRNGTGTDSWSFRARAIIRVSTAKSFFPLFLEPIKGQFANFIGMEWTSTNSLQCLAQLSGGTSTAVNSVQTMDTNDHTYELRYQSGSLPQVQCVYDGIVIGTITTATSIFKYPGSAAGTTPVGPELECCEPNGQVMAVYLKTPFLIPVAL